MAEVKWIKIVTDIFDDEKMLLIDSLPECDGIIVIWFKLLCLAGKQNNGGVFMFNDRIAYTDEMLATIFRRPLNTVRLALTTFEKYGMIEIVNNTITIPKWEKHQKADDLAKIREQTRQRVEKFREKQAMLACNATSNVTVTLRNATDKDKDKDKDIDAVKTQKYTSEIEEIISYLNVKADSKYRTTTDSTRRHLNARLSEGFTVEDCKTVIDVKCAEWKGTDMAKYLRPETLFGSKFESYLNQKKGGGQYVGIDSADCY